MYRLIRIKYVASLVEIRRPQPYALVVVLKKFPGSWPLEMPKFGALPISWHFVTDYYETITFRYTFPYVFII